MKTLHSPMILVFPKSEVFEKIDASHLRDISKFVKINALSLNEKKNEIRSRQATLKPSSS
jgi:hypothetical protein